MKNVFSIRSDLFPLLKIAMPLALTGMIQSGVFFFETLFLAHVNEQTLAAGALVSWLFGTIAVILFGILSSINILVALRYGANDREGISIVARDGLYLALFMSIPAFLLFWNMSPLFLLFGQSEAIVLLAQTYLHALAWGLLPNFLMVAILEVIVGIGHTRIIMIFTILSVGINIILSYILIFGKLGFPILGIAGAGWGTAISYWITLIALIIYIFFDKKYQIYFHLAFNFRKPFLIFELLQVGLPMGLMYCFEVAFFFALTLMMGSLSSKLLAANQVVLQYLGLLMSSMFSIAQAITVRMGHLLGANEIRAASKAIYLGVAIAAIFMSLVAILYWFFPRLLISVDFNLHDPNNFEIIHYVQQLFMISALFQIFEAMRIALFGALRGLKDTKFTLFISIISFWGIAFPIGYLFAFTMRLGGIGFWFAMVIGAAFSVILLFYRFQSKIQHYH